MSGREIHASTAIDGILRGLTNRPNVQATLILSRKDGSIIRATGFQETRTTSSSGPQGYTAPDSSDKNGSEQAKNDVTSERVVLVDQDTAATPSEKLASCIHAFVMASADLAASITLSEPTGGSYSGQVLGSTSMVQEENKTVSPADRATDEEVQLLRMRTKTQEIIIFPDPSYLCCVIQNIAKRAT